MSAAIETLDLFRLELGHRTNNPASGAVAEAVGVPWVYEVRGQLADTWASTRGPEALRSDRYALFTAREDDAVRSADGVVTLGEQMARRIAAAGELAAFVESQWPANVRFASMAAGARADADPLAGPPQGSRSG